MPTTLSSSVQQLAALDKARQTLREAEKDEEKAYEQLFYLRKAMWDDYKDEDLFRAKLVMDRVTDEELDVLIPRASQLYHLYAPVGDMHAEKKRTRKLSASPQLTCVHLWLQMAQEVNTVQNSIWKTREQMQQVWKHCTS